MPDVDIPRTLTFAQGRYEAPLATLVTTALELRLSCAS